MKGNGVYLVKARELAAYEPRRPRADVALHAFNPGVRRSLMGGEFRLHHGMTCLPAERDTVHIVHRAVGKLAGDDYVDHGGNADKDQQLSQFTVLEIQRRKAGRIRAGAALLSTLPENAKGNQNEPGKNTPGNMK